LKSADNGRQEVGISAAFLVSWWSGTCNVQL